MPFCIESACRFFNFYCFRRRNDKSFVVFASDCSSEIDAASTEALARYATSWYMVFQLWTTCLLRVSQAVITFGAMIPAGLFFIPSLFPGACMGRAWGLMLLLVDFDRADPAL